MYYMEKPQELSMNVRNMNSASATTAIVVAVFSSSDRLFFVSPNLLINIILQIM
jgi:hypothetical protein